jgi:hypothetical protein
MYLGHQKPAHPGLLSQYAAALAYFPVLFCHATPHPGGCGHKALGRSIPAHPLFYKIREKFRLGLEVGQDMRMQSQRISHGCHDDLLAVQSLTILLCGEHGCYEIILRLFDAVIGQFIYSRRCPIATTCGASSPSLPCSRRKKLSSQCRSWIKSSSATPNLAPRMAALCYDKGADSHGGNDS